MGWTNARRGKSRRQPVQGIILSHFPDFLVTANSSFLYCKTLKLPGANGAVGPEPSETLAHVRIQDVEPYLYAIRRSIERGLLCLLSLFALQFRDLEASHPCFEPIPPCLEIGLMEILSSIRVYCQGPPTRSLPPLIESKIEVADKFDIRISVSLDVLRP